MIDILLFDRDVLKVWLTQWVIDLLETPTIEVPQEIVDLAQQRLEAKQSKDYATADTLRDHITQAGWTVKDTADWFEIVPNE
jgi:cysteinyl-tRNA synthetase